MNPIQLFDPASSTFTYVLFDEKSTESPRPAIIIDPVDDQLERDLEVLCHNNLKLIWALETHAHADHITSAGRLAEHAGAQTAAPDACGITTAGKQLVDGDVLNFGGQHITALHTPGHTAGSMNFVWKHGADSAAQSHADIHVFTGDPCSSVAVVVQISSPAVQLLCTTASPKCCFHCQTTQLCGRDMTTKVKPSQPLVLKK